MADSRIACSHCGAPACECSCNCMNMKENRAEEEHTGLFDFSWKNKRSNKCAHGDLAGINNISRP